MARAPAICIMYICTNVIDCRRTSSTASPNPSRMRRAASLSVALRTTSPMRMGRRRLTPAITTSVPSEYDDVTAVRLHIRPEPADEPRVVGLADGPFLVKRAQLLLRAADRLRMERHGLSVGAHVRESPADACELGGGGVGVSCATSASATASSSLASCCSSANDA